MWAGTSVGRVPYLLLTSSGLDNALNGWMCTLGQRLYLGMRIDSVVSVSAILEYKYVEFEFTIYVKVLVVYLPKRSRWRIQNNGLQQGSVLAHMLFNIYTNDQPVHPNT